MPARSLLRLLAATLVVVVSTLAIAGCTATVRGTAGPGGGPPPSNDPVSWVDSVCGSLVGLRDATSKKLELSDTDLAATQRVVSGYLDGAITALNEGEPKLDAAGPSPVSGGDQVTARVKAEIIRLRKELNDLKVKIDAANPTDQVGFGLVMIDVGRALQQLGRSADPLAGLNANADLRRAAIQSANCRSLSGPLTSPTPSR